MHRLLAVIPGDFRSFSDTFNTDAQQTFPFKRIPLRLLARNDLRLQGVSAGIDDEDLHMLCRSSAPFVPEGMMPKAACPMSAHLFLTGLGS